LGTTAYGGAFLLMHDAARLYRIAQRFLRSLGSRWGGRLVLSLYFKAILGVQRIFHFETLDDLGFALLTGSDTKVVSRSRLGQLIRKVSIRSIRRFMQATAPGLARAVSHCISIDEHALARFTRKFRIPKGFHTIRNKKMKIEKITFAFNVATRELISLVVSTGKATLVSLTQKLLPSLRRHARGAPLRLLLDAGAATNHDELLDLALRENQVTIVRAPRRPSYRKAWQQIPAQTWTQSQEPGPYKAAAPKAIAIAETTTAIRGKRHRQAHHTRTIVIRESGKHGKERWHALWVFGDDQTPASELVHEFRSRQHHEQTYRVMLHDIHVDTAPSGYSKQSRDPDRPGFKQNALTLYSWLAALATNALLALTERLPQRFRRAHPRTLRRWFLNTPANLYLGQDTLIVSLRPRRMLAVWRTLIAWANRRNTRIPWLDNRQLILSIDTPPYPGRPEGSTDPDR